MRQLVRRLGYLVRHRQVEDDLAEEMAFHLDAKQRELERAGASPAEARLAAQRAMGNTALTREDARTVWVWPWLEQGVQDLRFGIRTLARSPGFTFVALVTLSLGIGANAAIFSLLNAMFLKPLPVASPGELVGAFQNYEHPASYADYVYYRDHNTVFSGLAAFSPVYLADGNDARELDGYLVTGNYPDDGPPRQVVSLRRAVHGLGHVRRRPHCPDRGRHHGELPSRQASGVRQPSGSRTG